MPTDFRFLPLQETGTLSSMMTTFQRDVSQVLEKWFLGYIGFTPQRCRDRIHNLKFTKVSAGGIEKSGVPSQEVTCLKFSQTKGETKAVLVKCACKGNMVGGRRTNRKPQRPARPGQEPHKHSEAQW